MAYERRNGILDIRRGGHALRVLFIRIRRISMGEIMNHTGRGLESEYQVMEKEFKEKLAAAEARIEGMQYIIRSQNAEIIRLREKLEGNKPDVIKVED